MLKTPYLPHPAEIVERIQESPDIFTLRLRFTDPEIQKNYRFAPGQFNMLYLHGVGEVPISIVSDPETDELYDHTIRTVGRVTQGIEKLGVGDEIGVRGPYGRGWPLLAAQNKNIVVVTGGLGCAPVVAAIRYFLNRRENYGEISLVHGIKHSNELIYQNRLKQYATQKDFKIFISADQATKGWPWYTGRITELIPQVNIIPDQTIALICGPELMMKSAAKMLMDRGIAQHDIYVSLERSMQCAIGHCGHCQMRGKFLCKDGPVFSYDQIEELLMKDEL